MFDRTPAHPGASITILGRIIPWTSIGKDIDALDRIHEFRLSMNAPSLRPTGFNLGGWLSQSPLTEAHIQKFIVEEDFTRIAAWGFNSVRLPVDGHWLFRQEGKGSLRPERFDLLTRALDWARRAGLLVILDIHQIPWHSFSRPGRMELCDQQEAIQVFANQWKELARELRNWDCPLWYDVLNEPTAEPDDWHRTLQYLVPAIREEDGNKPLVLESTKWGSIQHIPSLVESVRGERIVYSFHFYEPLFVTHQHARWWREGRPYVEDVQYPGPIPKVEEYLQRDDLPEETRAKLSPHRGRIWNRETLKELFSPLKRLRDGGIELYCGEFGVIDQATSDTRFRWNHDVVEILTEMGIGWSYWNYRNLDFGVWTGPLSGANDRLLEPILGALQKGI